MTLIPQSSLQDSSYGVPIGTVMAWPLDSAPRGLHRDRWLECNGQAVDSNKYPRLAKLMSNVPDYRGMFLRGLGGNSDSLGAPQGDAARKLLGFWGDYPNNGTRGTSSSNNAFYVTYFGGGPVSTFYMKEQYDAYIYSYRYTLSGDKENGYTLIETKEQPNINYTGDGGMRIYFDSSRVWPTANEFRPVNKAVRYMIKAK